MLKKVTMVRLLYCSLVAFVLPIATESFGPSLFTTRHHHSQTKPKKIIDRASRGANSITSTTTSKIERSPLFSSSAAAQQPGSKEDNNESMSFMERVKKSWDTILAASLVPSLLAFGIGYGIGLKQIAKQAVGSAGKTATRPPYFISAFLFLMISREIWRAIPAWLKRSIPFVGGKNSIEEGDPNDMTSIFSIGRKLSSLFDVMSAKLESSPDNARSAFFALMKLNTQIREQRGQDRDERYLLAGEVVDDPNEVLQGLDETFEFADLAYNELDDDKTIKDVLQEQGFALLRHDVTALPGSVQHYVALSKERKQILIGVKGTSSFEDMLTDLCGQAVEHELEGPFVKDGPTKIRCHEGVIEAATRLADDLSPLVEQLIFPSGYEIVITGHSLGAGVSAVCAVILRSRFEKLLEDDGNMLRVYAFASPPVLDHDSALASKSFCTTIINNSDIIPRCSLSNVIVTLELVKTVSERMKERGIDPSGLKSAKAYAQMMVGDEEMILTPEEMKSALDKIQDSVDLEDDDHLYCPGKIIHLFDLWAKDGAGEVEEELEKEVPPINGENVEAALENVKTAEKVYIADGISKVLRYIEIDSRMLSDHLSPAYRSSLKSLVTPSS